ncbi:60S ribosomal protein L24 [Aspergillus brasiliensis]|uniref:60S ribosomal protein L24 n=1 Tax=Aspergillus brasiliensis TaxID=319629 RepID=A0A9W6DLP4_9EURO|nr:60S ribosomal protein L24 [Aspergillus brasiliensis]GKZ43887.1 60S ribosomal protein L24 [Aspergillus brasiliensis]
MTINNSTMKNEDNMDTSREATDQPHAFQAESEDPGSSNISQLTNDITNQFARAFHITDRNDDPLFLPALFTKTVNLATTEQHIREESDARSLDFSSQSLHSVSNPLNNSSIQESHSASSASLHTNNTNTAARNLHGILRSNKGTKIEKKVKFATPPGKVVKCYKSTQEEELRIMGSWFRHLKSIFQSVTSKDGQTAKRDRKKITLLMPEDHRVEMESGKYKDENEGSAGTKYDNDFLDLSTSSIDDLVAYIRQATACPKKLRNLKDYWKRQRGDDVRVWGYRNPWCTNCYGECPICGSACCVYEELRRAVSDEESDPLVSRDRKRIIGLMETVAESMSARPVAAYAQTSVVKMYSARSAKQIPGPYATGTSSQRAYSRSPRSGEVEAEANQPRAGAVTWHRLARLRTAPQLCQSHEQLAAETASTQPPNANRQHLVSTGCASQTFKMRTYDDSFSGQKIYPGKGKLYVRGDSKIFRFQNGKSESLFLQRKNPRRIAWTVLYRRQHKKGISEEVAKKRTRRVVKSQRGIVGASLDVIKERRSQRPEARAAARQQAIKDAKEKKAANESRKRAEKAKSAASGAKPAQRIQSKQGAKGSAPKVAAKSR